MNQIPTLLCTRCTVNGRPFEERLLTRNEVALQFQCGHFFHERCTSIAKEQFRCLEPSCQKPSFSYTIVWIKEGKKPEKIFVIDPKKEQKDSLETIYALPDTHKNALFLRSECAKLENSSSLMIYQRISWMNERKKQKFMRLALLPEYRNEVTDRICENFARGRDQYLCSLCCCTTLSCLAVWLTS